MIKASLIGKMKDGSEVYEVRGPLDKQIKAFKDIEIIFPYLATLSQVAQIRLEGVNTDGSRTSYAPAKVKGKPTIITSDSPYMNEAMAMVAMQAHKSGEYPQFQANFYEALEQIAKTQDNLEPEDRTVHILEGKPDSEGVITLTPEMPDTRFLLKKPAKEYFKKFNHKSINFYDLLDNAPKDKTHVNYLWFDYPQNGSELDARSRDLRDGDWAFGVLEKSAKGASQKSNHTFTNIRKAIAETTPKTLKDLDLGGLTEIISSPLQENVLAFFRNQ